MDEPTVVRSKTFSLRLTRFEVLHLRDLFSVMLPPALNQTLSAALAVAEERPMVEAKLWQKVKAACEEAQLPLDDDAPDFVAAAVSTPQIGVFRLAHDPAQQQGETQQPEADPAVVFDPKGDEDEADEDEDA